MTIHEANMQLRFRLFDLYDEREADNIADLIMERITGWKKIDRVVNKTVPLSVQQQDVLHDYTNELMSHRPVQYVLNEAWFYDMFLYVDENVLVPRPETEELVDWLLKDLQQPGTVLDIGTGSGCIALAIKKHAPQLTVHACDISEGALKVAQRNAGRLYLDMQFHQLDILSAAAQASLPIFDIIISNPPYIPQSDQAEMTRNVLDHEPWQALFVENNDPLLFYSAIAVFAKDHLSGNGAVYLEIHEAMGNAVAAVFEQQGFNDVEIRKDLQGKDRMVKAKKLVDASVQ